MEPLLDKRPWGEFRQYTLNEVSTVKIITVKSGGMLSKQFHYHREELWVMLDDGLQVEIGGKKILAKKEDQFFIPKKTTHRISSEMGGRFLEIAFGKFDENDIVRMEDNYGRK